MPVQRLFDLLPYQLAKYPRSDAMGYKTDAGEWHSLSTEDVWERILAVSRALLAIGVKPGDKIAIISPNRPTWTFLDFGMMRIGAICVPIYPTISDREYQYILSHAEVKWIFVANEELLAKVDAVKDRLSGIEGIYSLDKIQNVAHWTDILGRAEEVTESEVEAISDQIASDDLVTIIYTSGTTGDPKGVMLSHYNILCNIESVLQLLPVDHQHRAISFLPMCHIFERMVVYTYIYLGIGIYYIRDLSGLMDDLKIVQPHVFSTVPRLLEKIYEAIVHRGHQLTGWRKKLFFWALNIGMQYQLNIDQGNQYRRKLRWARRLVFWHWRKALGGEIQAIVCGAAALPPYLCKVFCAAGIPVREGYGQTEASPVISFNRFEPGGAKEGSVGIPIPGVEVKITGDGEICARGPNVMMGYYQNPEATAQTIDADGWLHTGDVGRIVGGRFLQITDRVKEVFKTSGGKYIAPQPIENHFRESDWIDQIMVVGKDRKFVSALIVPDFARLEQWRIDKGLPEMDRNSLMKHPQILENYHQICAEFNQEFGRVEQIRNFTLLAENWTVENQMLTPTHKVKRREIHKRYEKEIAYMYQ